jgi:glycosyltransferase involved in cell wall biosynthesis
LSTRPLLTIFHHFDPWSTTSVGGIDTLIRAYVKHAPANFDLRIVGAGARIDRLGEWRTTELEGRPVQFMAVFRRSPGNAKPRVPDTLRFAVGLAGKRLESDFMHFHAIEPTLSARHWRGDKTLFVHIDIERQLYTPSERNESLWRRFPRAYLSLERAVIGQFDRVLSCNRAALDFHRRRYPALAGRFALIRNCVDAAVFQPLDSRGRDQTRSGLAHELGVPAGTRFVLFSGRLERMKDPFLLLRAFARLNAPRTHLLIAGDGSLHGAIVQALGDLGIAGKVTLFGAVPARRLAELYRASSVLVLTSAYEGLPLTALEALACGTPVVSTPAGDIACVVSEAAGVVTHDFSEDAVSVALASVLAEPERYPVHGCVAAARGHFAQDVVPDVFQRMLAGAATPGGS